jgi:hypothetical protein
MRVFRDGANRLTNDPAYPFVNKWLLTPFYPHMLGCQLSSFCIEFACIEHVGAKYQSLLCVNTVVSLATECGAPNRPVLETLKHV